MVADQASSTVEIPVESTAVHHCNVVEGDVKNLSLLLGWATYCVIGIKTEGSKSITTKIWMTFIIVGQVW